MKIKLTLAALFLIFTLTFPAGAVKIYKWTDDRGVLHVVDDPDKIPREYERSVEVIDTEDGSLKIRAQVLLSKLKSRGAILLAGLVTIVLIFVFIKSRRRFNGREKEGERDEHSKAYELSGVDGMDRGDFKRHVIGLLEQRGYNVMIAAQTTSPVVDFIAEKDGLKYAVQVNTQKNNISRVVVNDLDREKTRYGCGKSMIISRQFSDDEAKRLGRSVGCSLVDRDTLARWIYNLSNKHRLKT